MLIKYLLVLDLGTFRELRKSGQRYPKLTIVIRNPDLVLALYLESLLLPLKELDVIWNQNMVAHIIKDFREIMFRVVKKSKKNGIKFRAVVEIDEGNTTFLKSMNYFEIRQLDSIKENLQITDNKICVKPLFDQDDEHFSQILWSNSEELVNQKKGLFENLWKVAIPIST